LNLVAFFTSLPYQGLFNGRIGNINFVPGGEALHHALGAMREESLKGFSTLTTTKLVLATTKTIALGA